MKRYINDIKEQNKFSSSQRRQRDQEFTEEHMKDKNCAGATGKILYININIQKTKILSISFIV